MQIPHLINLLHSDMTAWRQDLHAHPELGFEEHRTSEFVAGKLAEFGCEVHRNIGKTGVVGVLRTGNGPSIGLRADMDAFPIHDANDSPYRSKHEGRMHACGHDGHTTMLLGAARYLAETRDFAGTGHFISYFSHPRKASAARRRCFKMAYSSASRATASSGCT